MTEKIKIRPGSIAHMTLEAEKYDDILYIVADAEQPHEPVKIICKPDYNIDKVMEFVESNFTYGTPYKIIVENSYEVIKND